ncbi:MAG: TIGR02300 family protein [Deltaproteobacteria bacterium]|nr:MAG: TIGR02300 family protein [Deltaproteobacteria bacterium]
MDKSKLGIRYTCFKCGIKFYDLNRPEPLCPECGADQREAPVFDIKATLTGKGSRRKRREEKDDEEDVPVVSDDDDLDDLDDDDDDMFGVDDDDDDEDDD